MSLSFYVTRMVFAQTQGIWANELSPADIAGETVADEAADAAEDAVEDITDELPDMRKHMAEIVSDPALNDGETERAFDYDHLEIVPKAAEAGDYCFRYTGDKIEPHFDVKWSPSSNSTSSNSISGDKIELTEGTDYTIVSYEDNTDLGVAFATLSGNGVYSKETVEAWFCIVANPAYIAVTVSGSSLIVKNTITKTGAGEDKNTIYVAAVSGDGVPAQDASVKGTEVKAGESIKLTSCYTLGDDKKFVSKKIQPETKYYVYGCEDSEWLMSEKTREYWGVAYAGAYTTDKESKPVTEILNGDAIKLKAVTQKDQSVKLSWAPGKELGYKKFSIYRLKDDCTDINADASWKEILTDTAKKSFTDKDNIVSKGHNASRTGVYKLVAKDASGTVKESYLMVAAPWLFKTESGIDKDTQGYYITAHKQSESLSYRLQAAMKNKDNVQNGFSESERTNNIDSTTLWDDSYQVNKSLTVDYFMPEYKPEKTADILSIGTKYFFRVKSVYTYGDLIVTSAPSNVLSRKAGPVKGAVTNVKGITPLEYFEKIGVSEELQKKLMSGDEFALSGVHADSDGTCWKKGYVWFYMESLEGVKQIQLMRATSEGGKYSSVKKYPVGDVKKVEDSDIQKMVEKTSFQQMRQRNTRVTLITFIG